MNEDKQNTLRLYVSGITVENQEDILQFKKMLKDKSNGKYKLEVIDVFEQPELAEGEKIIATPTVVKGIQEPMKKVILNFSSKEKILMGMDILLK